MSWPLQPGLGLLRRLRPPVRTLAFSRPTAVGHTVLEFPSSVTRDVRATRRCLINTQFSKRLSRGLDGFFFLPQAPRIGGQSRMASAPAANGYAVPRVAFLHRGRSSYSRT